jgi:tetratricopeptide (TPR) repeat protein
MPVRAAAARDGSPSEVSRIPWRDIGLGGCDVGGTDDIQAEIVAAVSPDDLLDLAEYHQRRGQPEWAGSCWAAFDDRYARIDLTPLQRGRRADAYGIEAANTNRLAEAEAAWRSAIELFAQAGDEERRQAARGRLGRALCSTDRGEAGLALVEEAASYMLNQAGPDRWAGALVAVATALLYVGRPDDGLEMLDRASAYLPASLDPRSPGHVAVLRAQCFGALGRMDDARTAATAAARICRDLGYTEGLAHAALVAGFAAEQLDDGEGALDAYDDALAAATDPDLIARVRAHRAALLAGSSRAAEAVDDLIQAIRDRAAAGDAEGTLRAQSALAMAYLSCDRPDEAAAVVEEALAATDLSDMDDEMLGLGLRYHLAEAYRRLGRADAAIDQLELIAAGFRAENFAEGLGQVIEEIGDLLDRQDRDRAAAQRYLSAAEAFRYADHPVDECRNRRRHALSLLWADDQVGALAALATVDELSLDLPETEAAAWERANLLLDGAKILRMAGRLPEAAVRSEAAARAFRRAGHVGMAGHADLLHAETLLQTSRPAEAADAARLGLVEMPPGEPGRRRLEAVLGAALAALDEDRP